MKDERLAGKRYIAVMRCSTREQADTSIDDQQRLIQRFAADNGMVLVGEVRLEGVSGSVHENLDRVVKGLVQRKVDRNDFDVVVVQDASRFGRTGAGHAAKLRYDLEMVGVEVVTAMGHQPKSDFVEVTDALAATVARQQAKGIAAAVARGSQSALEQGRKAHSSVTPYALDKLYMTSDGRPLHWVRTDYAAGTQTRHDASTGVVIDRYFASKGGGVPTHYRKQKQELVTLIPGDPAAVEVVHTIYRRHFVDHWGYGRIAQALNDRRVTAPKGTGWSRATVKNILDNPIYSGRGIANRVSRALYYRRSPDMPAEATRMARADGKTQTSTYRRSSDWHVVQYPRLVDFLPADLRALAADRHQKRLDAMAAGHKPTPRDKHPESSYLLKGLLTTKEGLPMTGRRKGRKGCKRYYAVGKAHGTPTSDSTLRRMAPAEPLEAAVLEILRTTLRSLPAVRDQFIDAAKAALRGRQCTQADADAIKRDLNRIERRVDLLVDEFRDGDADVVRNKLAALKTEHRDLKRRLEAMARPLAITDQNIEHMVDGMIAMHLDDADSLRVLPAAHVRDLLTSIVESMTIDLSTMEVTLVVRMPLWAQGSLQQPAAKVGLDSTLVYRRLLEAHPPEMYQQHLVLPKAAWMKASTQ